LAGCQALFDRLLARDFSDPLFFGTHRIAVDTYALQHPERYCASAKSFAAHFLGLYVFLQRGSRAAVGNESVQRWLNGTRPLPKPEIPVERGRITIADVVDIASPNEYKAAVQRWAASTWSVYDHLRPLAETWSRAAASESHRRR
jgi:hypothetical protein